MGSSEARVGRREECAKEPRGRAGFKSVGARACGRRRVCERGADGVDVEAERGGREAGLSALRESAHREHRDRVRER